MFHRVFLCATLATSLAAPAGAETIYGLTNLQQLVAFDSATRTVTSTLDLQGFSLLGEIALGIDFRPATGQLYALSNLNNLFTIDLTSGARTQIGTSLAITGDIKAIDFNPTVDRLRVLGSGGTTTNLRVNPDTGAAIVDGNHAFAAGDSNAGDVPAVVNGAYTNSVAGATSTTLYTIEAGNDVLATQVPPNAGTLNTVGALGANVVTSGGFTGFDISGATGTAYLVGNSFFGGGGLQPNALYAVSLSSGLASNLGAISGINGSLRDIAVAPRAVPEPATLILAALGAAFGLRRRTRAGR